VGLVVLIATTTRIRDCLLLVAALWPGALLLMAIARNPSLWLWLRPSRSPIDDWNSFGRAVPLDADAACRLNQPRISGRGRAHANRCSF
jgi:hypothetical protein